MSVVSALFRSITPNQLSWLFLTAAIVGSIHKYYWGNVNNYRIFSKSLGLLLSHQNLYIEHPGLYADLYKYSPTFPLLMAPFVWQPEVTGFISWNVFNALVLLAGIRTLVSDPHKVVLALAIVAVEFFISIQNNQSNGLVSGLMLFAFASLEQRRPARAALFTALGFFVKVFGIAVALCGLFYPFRRQIFGWLGLWLVVLAAAPLTVVSVGELMQLYIGWYEIMSSFDPRTKASVMRLIERCCARDFPHFWVQLAAAVVCLLPFARFKHWNDGRFRRGVLCSLLIFVVIFSPAAESPAYVIAVTGVAIWYVFSRRTPLDHLLLAGVVILTSLASTDLYPKSCRTAVVGAYTLKPVGCFLVWLRIQYELLTGRFRQWPTGARMTNDE